MDLTPVIASLAQAASSTAGQNLLSGFVGAVVGGLLVAWNDARLQRRQNNRDDQAAGRLVCLELLSDYFHVENLAEFAMEGK